LKIISSYISPAPGAIRSLPQPQTQKNSAVKNTKSVPEIKVPQDDLIA